MSTGDALIVHDVELALGEGRGDLVLLDLDTGAVADDVVTGFDGLDAADVQAHGGVELEGVAAGGRLGVAEHDADLLAQLVGEDDDGVGLLDGPGELAQRLAHEAGLQADVAVAHLALDLGAGDKGGDGVDDDDVHGAGADEGVGDLQGLLAGVGLGDVELVDVDAALA
jgi:hypothetical protein